MRPPVTYAVAGERSSPRFGAAFARGCGGRVMSHTQGMQPGGFASFCSPPVWPLLRRAQAEGRDWFYGDHAYVGRGTHFRVTRNAYQHDGTGQGSKARWRALGRPIQPWRRSGHHIVLCPNSDVYFGFFGMTTTEWVADVTARLRAVTDRPLRVRSKRDARPIALDLVDAWAVVVYSSAAAIDALIAGVPAFTLADFAATYRMGTADLTRIEQPVYPDDRESFLWSLAAHQWTCEELARGDGWRALGERR